MVQTISVALTERIWLYNNTARARGSGFLALLLLAYKEEAHAPVDAWAFIVLYFVLCLIPTIVKQLKTKQLTTPIVPRAGIEPARTFVHWCLRPTRLPIPPSGLVRLGTKILQLLKVIHRQRKRSTLLPTLDYFKRCPDCSSEGFEGAVC